MDDFSHHTTDFFYDVVATPQTKRDTRKAQHDSPAVDGDQDDVPFFNMKNYKGTGRVFASIFAPPRTRPGSAARSHSPETLFAPALN